MKLYLALWLTLVGVTFVGVDSARADLTYSADTTSDGVHFVVISGNISLNDDLDKFNLAVATSSARAVMFNSPGGSIAQAMELGRRIRGLRLGTVQARAFECASACSLAFLGGVVRYAEPGSIGVHKTSFAENKTLSVDDAVSAVQQATAEVMGYMIEMGADPGLMQLALSYDSNDIRYLSASEMDHYRVTTPSSDPATAAVVAPAPLATPTPPTIQSPVIEPTYAAPPAMPQPHTGRVLHPKGSAPLKLAADGNSATIAKLTNGTSLQIVGNHERWYQVKTGNLFGFMHHTWVYVDQYESGKFGSRHIQIRSFDNYADAEAFARSSKIPVTAYLVTNGWFAVALTNTPAELGRATVLLNYLKKIGQIPDDSFSTYGTTYIRKVCCD